MATLTGNAINTSYEGLLKTLDNAAINGTNRVISDGVGNVLPLEASTTTIKFTGNADFTSATVTGIAAGGLVSGTGTNSLQSGITGATGNASSTNSIAIGVDAVMSGGFGAAIGVYSEAAGNYANAFGSLCNASGTNSLAAGKQATASTNKAVSLGIEVTSGGTESVIIGSNISTTAYRAISIGQGNQVGQNSTTIGQYSRTGSSSIAMGDNANNLYGAKNNAVSLGAGANAETNSTAVGQNTKALGQNSVAIGKDSQSNAYGAIALGDGVIAATPDTLTVKLLQIANYTTMNFADDAAAATGGIPLGGVYHTSGALKIRIS